MAFPGKADLPTDLALDLRLREILQQARLATAASGAVIALARGDKIVCRATLGDKAPSAGVSLNTRSGLSGACVQTREMQLCDDTLADPRVNAVACRDLGIRSIVVLPVLDGGELWGVLELFSSVPHAFSESDLQALQALSRKISSTVREAIDSGSTTLALEAFSQPPVDDLVEPKRVEPEALPALDRPGAGIVRRDYRTGALSAAVLALAVLLGWMVGRVGWTMAVNRAPAQFPMTPEEAQATAPVTPAVHPAPPRQEPPPTTVASPVASRPVPPPAAKPAPKPKPATATPLELNGGLVVYEHGKVVFRMGPSEKEVPPKAAPGVGGLRCDSTSGSTRRRRLGGARANFSAVGERLSVGAGGAPVSGSSQTTAHSGSRSAQCSGGSRGSGSRNQRDQWRCAAGQSGDGRSTAVAFQSSPAQW